MDLGFADATAVMAGGTRGIGLATAQCLAEHGARVGVVGRDEARLTETATTLGDAGSPEVLTLSADLGSASDVDAVFETVARGLGRTQRAGQCRRAVGGRAASRIWATPSGPRRFDQGVLSAVRCVRAALPLLRAARWARVVNVTAMSVQHQSPGLVSYTAAKSALLSVTKNLARSPRRRRHPGQRRRPGSDPHRLGAADAAPPPGSRRTTPWAPSDCWGGHGMSVGPASTRPAAGGGRGHRVLRLPAQHLS